MKDKIAKKILEMEKDKLMSEPESDRDWELITALDIAIEALEEANNDLISREALKNHITDVYEHEEKIDKKWALGLKYSLKIIDLAPAVEPFEPNYVGAERLKARQRGYEDGYHNGMEIGKTLNPQIKRGEWILNKDENPECPFCHHSFTYWGNFCGNCGADLKGGAGNDK